MCWIFSLSQCQADCWRGAAVTKVLSLSTRRKSGGTSNNLGSSGPALSSTTSEPQVETRFLEVSRSLTSLCSVVESFTGKPGSTPVRWTSILSNLLTQFPAVNTDVTTTPPSLFFGCRHSGTMDISTSHPSVFLSELPPHEPGLAMRFSLVMM